MNWSILSLYGARDVNEDSAKVIEKSGKYCFVVADGLGGHGKGDVASTLATAAFEKAFSNALQTSLSETIEEAFRFAQADILAEQQATGSHFQMKTTVCALAVEQNEVVWAHIGDTRLYAFSRNKVLERTLDHSVPQMLVLSKEIKEKDIRNHPDRNKLLRVLGVSGEQPRYEISESHDLRRYQAFLLCSDGFWELILEKEMCHWLKKSKTVDEWLNHMRDVVETRGRGADMDNYTAIAIWV